MTEDDRDCYGDYLREMQEENKRLDEEERAQPEKGATYSRAIFMRAMRGVEQSLSTGDLLSAFCDFYTATNSHALALGFISGTDFEREETEVKEALAAMCKAINAAQASHQLCQAMDRRGDGDE